MKDKYKKILITISVLLVLILSISFAYFLTNVVFSGKGASTTATTSNIEGTKVVIEGSIEFNDLEILPGHKNISSIKLTATGEETVKYNLIWTGINTLNTSLNYKIYKTSSEEAPSISCEKKQEAIGSTSIYYEECIENNFDALGEVVASGTVEKITEERKKKLIINESIEATSEGTVIYYYVVLEYPNKDESQNIDIGGSFDGVLSAESNKKDYVVYTKDSDTYTKVESIPTSNYLLNTENSYCENYDGRVEATLNYNTLNKELEVEAEESDLKCHLYFDVFLHFSPYYTTKLLKNK